MKRRSAVGPLLAAVAVPASAAGNGTTPAWPPARRRVGGAGPVPANRHRASIAFYAPGRRFFVHYGYINY